MELVFIFAKFFEYLVIVPVWWVATYFAAFVYPVEHDSRQDFLAAIFSFFIIIGLIGGCSYALRSPSNKPPPVQTANRPLTPEEAALKAQLAILREGAGISAAAAGEGQKDDAH